MQTAQSQRGGGQGSRQQAASSNAASSTQGSRQQAAGENQAQRQQAANENQAQRQEQGAQNQQNRQETYEDAHWSGSYYRYPGGAAAGAAAIAVGTAVTMNTMQKMTTPSGGQPAACSMTSVTVSGVNYYQCGPNWFQKAYVNGEMSYVAVAPPAGA